MLLPDNIHPDNSIYYNGALVLNVLHDFKKIDLLDLFYEVRLLRQMSFSIFLLSLDWLYLTDIIENIDGSVKLCS